ncbi:hypothetical protein LEP1GSC096_0747 [Leptospira interrogans serovar Hebdomadis str. R499]|nr:hypothetical protein LEP1GSC096_0747 [Leptospira interrogans serovar Hebdomadis str. R499]
MLDFHLTNVYLQSSNPKNFLSIFPINFVNIDKGFDFDEIG